MAFGDATFGTQIFGGEPPAPPEIPFYSGSSRPEWRYIAARLNGDGTSTFLDFDVPLTGVEIEDALSGPGGMTAAISPEYMRLKTPDGRPMFDEWSTALFAESEGNIRGGGILVHSEFEGPEWSIECVGFTGYADEMPYTGPGKFWVKTDTLDIWRAIWNHIQTQDGGNIGLEISPDKSGRIVGSTLASEEYDPEGGAGGLTLESQAYKLQWYADHDLSENLSGLAEDSPFDYHETHFWDGDVIRHRVDFGVPRLGRRRDDLRFVVGENIFTKPGVERNGEDYADEVYVLGAGEGAAMIRGHARKPRTRLRRVAVVSDSGARKLSRANKRAERELKWRQKLDDISSVIVRNSTLAPIGSLSVGDEIWIGGETGWVEIGSWYRVLTINIRPSDGETMELAVARSDRIE